MDNSSWLDIEVLDDYLEGKLDASTMHKVERLSLEDPFVAEALAGLAETKRRTQTISILQKQLQERVAEKPVERKMWRLVSHRLSIAATAAVIFVTVSILFWMRTNKIQDAELANRRAKGVEVTITDKAEDSLAPQAASLANIDTAKVSKTLNETLAKGENAVAVAKVKPSPQELPSLKVEENSRVSEVAMQVKSVPAMASVVLPDSLNEVKITSVKEKAKRAAVETNGVTAKVSGLSIAANADELVIGVPEMGMKAYQEYLVKNNRLYVSGEKSVLINFKISVDGYPTDIKIEKSEGLAFDNEAVRLLKEAGKWKRPTGMSSRINTVIKF